MTPDLHARRAETLKAVDFRGDVTIVCIDGRRVEGFAFDAKLDGSDEDCVRLLAQGSDARIAIRLREIESIECTGKDAASGRTWENWIKRYAEKKLAGESASIESERLD
jgi:hypothetical protein